MYTGLSSRLPVGAVRNKGFFGYLSYGAVPEIASRAKPLMLFGKKRTGTSWTTGTVFGFDCDLGSLTGSNNLADFRVGGTSRFSIGAGGLVTTTSIALSSATSFASFGGDTFLQRVGVANIKLGQSDSASPTAQTFSVQNVVAGTSNTAGAPRNYDGSVSTGDAIGGSHIFRTSPAGSSGTSQNALVTAFTINGDGTSTFANNQYGQLGTAAGVVVSLPRSYSAVYNG